MEDYFNLPACSPDATPACAYFNNWDQTETTNMNTNFLTTQFATEPTAGDLVFSYVELQDFGWVFNQDMS